MPSSTKKGLIIRQSENGQFVIDQSVTNRAYRLAGWFDRADREPMSTRQLARAIQEENLLSGDNEEKQLPSSRSRLGTLRTLYVEGGRNPLVLIDGRLTNKGMGSKIPEDICLFIRGAMATERNTLALAYRQMREIANGTKDENEKIRDVEGMFHINDIPSYTTIWRYYRDLPDVENPKKCQSIGGHYEDMKIRSAKSNLAPNEQWHLDECEFKLFDSAAHEMVSIYVTAVVDYRTFVIRSINASREYPTSRNLMYSLKTAFKRNPKIDMDRDALPHFVVLDGPQRHRCPGIAHLNSCLQTKCGRKVRVLPFHELPMKNASAERMMRKVQEEFAQSFKTYFAAIKLYFSEGDYLIDDVDINNEILRFAKWHNNQCQRVRRGTVKLRRLTEYDREASPESWNVSRTDIDQYVKDFTEVQTYKPEGIRLDGRDFGCTKFRFRGRRIRVAYPPEGATDSVDGWVVEGENLKFFGILERTDTDRAKRHLNAVRLKVTKAAVKKSAAEREGYMFMYAKGRSLKSWRKRNREGGTPENDYPLTGRRKKASTRGSRSASRKLAQTPKGKQANPKATPPAKLDPSNYTFSTRRVRK